MATVETHFQDGIFEIILNRPEKYNALNAELAQDLKVAVNEAKSDPDVRAVLVYGNGKGFCAGGDLVDFGIDVSNPTEVREFLQVGHDAILGIYHMEKPVIGAIHGPAVGAGCNLAFACDLVVAEENAIFSELFNKVGAIPDFGGLYFLPQKVGMHIASELIFTGKKLSAKEAKDYGLINEVTEEGNGIERGRELARMLANGPTKTFGMAKTIMHQAPYMRLEDALQLEAHGQAVTFQTEDFKEGRAAFVEKRKPNFKGK